MLKLYEKQFLTAQYEYAIIEIIIDDLNTKGCSIMSNRISMFGLKITQRIDKTVVPALAKVRPVKKNTHRADS